MQFSSMLVIYDDSHKNGDHLSSMWGLSKASCGVGVNEPHPVNGEPEEQGQGVFRVRQSSDMQSSVCMYGIKNEFSPPQMPGGKDLIGRHISSPLCYFSEACQRCGAVISLLVCLTEGFIISVLVRNRTHPCSLIWLSISLTHSCIDTCKDI